MPAEFDSGAFIREPAWHREGVVLPDYTENVREMQIAAGLTWEVTTEPVFAVGRYDVIDVERFRATMRSDNDAVLGIVSNTYEPIQNDRLFEFAEALADDPSVKIETAGSLQGGRKVWLQVRLGDNLLVESDPTTPYLTIATSHDGSMAFTAFPTFVRIVCANTFNHALDKKSTAYKVKHTLRANARVNDARQLLELGFRQTEVFTEEVERMLNTSITRDKVSDNLLAMFPPVDEDTDSTTNTRRGNVRAKISHIYDTFPTIEPVRGTAWGWVNAVNEYEQWYQTVRASGGVKPSHEERLIGNFLAGDANTLTREAIKLVTA